MKSESQRLEFTTSAERAHLGVDKPEHRASLLLRHSLLLKVLADGLCDSNTTRSSTKEEDALVLQRQAGELESADSSCEDDGSGSLDVVVEARVLFAVSGEKGEGESGVEVLELNDLKKESARGGERRGIKLQLTMLGNVLCISSINTLTKACFRSRD